ncbi:unnamed protein product, partial [Discosporangium mesarthrocarpum]
EEVVAGVAAEVAVAEGVVGEAEAEHKRLQGEYQSMCAGVAMDSKEDSRTLADQVAAAAAEVTACVAKAAQEKARVKHLRGSAKTTEKDIKVAENQVSQLRKDHERALATATKARRELESLGYDKGPLDALTTERDQEERAVEGLRETVNRLQAQLAGRLSFEYSNPERGFDRSRVKGFIARLVQVPNPAHATALEVAAGGKLYQVVVDTEVTGKLLLKNGKLRK